MNAVVKTALEKWLEGDKIMGFCPRKNVECECITPYSSCNSSNCYRHLPDITEQSKENKMTFKEQLTNKANKYEENIPQKDIDFLKSEMKSCYHLRHFDIYLYDSHTTIAIGHGRLGSANFFIPRGANASRYCNKYIEALEDMGFDKTDIALEVESMPSCDTYKLSITW